MIVDLEAIAECALLYTLCKHTLPATANNKSLYRLGPNSFDVSPTPESQKEKHLEVRCTQNTVRTTEPENICWVEQTRQQTAGVLCDWRGASEKHTKYLTLCPRNTLGSLSRFLAEHTFYPQYSFNHSSVQKDPGNRMKREKWVQLLVGAEITG